MTAKLYSEVNQNTIHQLKLKGYTNVRFDLLDQGNPYLATIELVPGRGEDFELNAISLHSNEISYYIDEYSPMARYVIDEEYLRTASH